MANITLLKSDGGPVFRSVMTALGGGAVDPYLRKYAQLLAPEGAIPCTVHIPADSPTGLEDGILHAVRDKKADLLIAGARSDSSRRKLVRRLAMKAPSSVLIVPDGSPGKIQNILVTVDFSPRSADAFHVAAALARQLDLPHVRVLHTYFDEASVGFEPEEAAARKRVEHEFELFLGPLDTCGRKLCRIIDQTTSLPHAVQAIVGRGEADLVVMGTRGRSASASILLGSQTEDVIRAATIPVLAVKHFGSNLGLLDALLGTWNETDG